jgi:hypothetical protein
LTSPVVTASPLNFRRDEDKPNVVWADLLLASRTFDKEGD